MPKVLASLVKMCAEFALRSQRLRRNAADVEADSAPDIFGSTTACSGLTERREWPRHIRRDGSDDDDVIVGHAPTLVAGGVSTE